MKFTIKQHKEWLANRKKALDESREQSIRDILRMDKEFKELTFYAEQINVAERLKKDGFDDELFLKKRKT